MKQRTLIGRNTTIEFVGHTGSVPAKVDTGADGSALWASRISVGSDQNLHFVLFDESSPLYTGEEIIMNQFGAAAVRSSTGTQQIRYRVRMLVRLEGRQIRANFTLADRSTQQFPVLIGRRTLKNKFLVDVAREEHPVVAPEQTRSLKDELKEDPKRFHEKYYKQSSK